MSYFPNLAGNQYCDDWIEKELIAAGITISSGRKNWKKYRAKYRLIIEGQKSLYESESYIYMNNSEVPFHIMGKLNGFIFERDWYYYRVKGKVPFEIAKKIYDDPIGKKKVRVNGNAGRIAPKGDIDSYHIDNQEGLNLFVKYIKELNKKGDD